MNEHYSLVATLKKKKIRCEDLICESEHLSSENFLGRMDSLQLSVFPDGILSFFNVRKN